MLSESGFTWKHDCASKYTRTMRQYQSCFQGGFVGACQAHNDRCHPFYVNYCRYSYISKRIYHTFESITMRADNYTCRFTRLRRGEPGSYFDHE